MKITTCILARDSGAYIERALFCAKGQSEIVVFDHGSVDDTAKIARRFADKVVTLEREEHLNFGWVRNRMSWEAANDIVFHLDADEFVNPLLFSFLEANSQRIGGGLGLLPLYESYSPGFCDPTLINQMKGRIYDRRAGLWLGEIHESLLGRCWKNIYQVPFPIHHRSFKYDFASLWEKIKFYDAVMKRPSRGEDEWKAEYESIYARQVRYPSKSEYDFALELYRMLPWKTEGVKDRQRAEGSL